MLNERLSSKMLQNYYTANLDPVLDKLLSFESLPDGWHYGRGAAISLRVVSNSIDAMTALRALGAQVIEVFPSIDGSVLISAFGENTCIDVTVSESSFVNYVVEHNDSEVAAAEKVSYGAFWQKIKEERWLACTSLDSSIRGTTVTRNAGLPHWRSTTQTERVYQWYANAA